MKNTWEWDENDLFQLVKDEVKESIDLDFKESPALQNSDSRKNEISKDVSALANSAGGTLIYGMKENGHVATGLDNGSDPKIVTKEWLEQVMNSRIHRKIDGIRINQVELKKTKKGNVAYVIYVPASNRAPHQAYDKKFYKRYNFESVPMEEYEVRDVSRRDETPDLRIVFNLPSSELKYEQDATESEPFILRASITNEALEPANYAVIRLYFDKRLIIQDAGELENSEGAILLGKEQYQVHVLSRNWGLQGNMPIFYTPFRVSNTPIKLKIKAQDRFQEKDFLLGYEIHSPRMPMKQGFQSIRLRTASVSLSASYTPNELVQNLKSLIK